MTNSKGEQQSFIGSGWSNKWYLLGANILHYLHTIPTQEWRSSTDFPEKEL
jgi:hypothetical protein